MVVLKTDGNLIAKVTIVNIVNKKFFEVWIENATEPIHLKFDEVLCIS